MLLRRLLEAVKDVKKAVQQHTESEQAAETTNRVISFDDKTVRDAETEHDRQYRVQNSIRWATWLAVVGAIAYASVAACQLVEMRKATQATQEAAGAATKAANVAENTFRLTQRPRLKILSVGLNQEMRNGKMVRYFDNGKLTFQVDVPNMGPFDAINVRFYRYEVISKWDQIAPRPYEELHGEPKTIRPKAEIVATGLNITGQQVATPSELKGLKLGTLWDTFSILITYQDEFGKEIHHAEFCRLSNLKNGNEVCPWPVQND